MAGEELKQMLKSLGNPMLEEIERSQLAGTREHLPGGRDTKGSNQSSDQIHKSLFSDHYCRLMIDEVALPALL